MVEITWYVRDYALPLTPGLSSEGSISSPGRRHVPRLGRRQGHKRGPVPRLGRGTLRIALLACSTEASKPERRCGEHRRDEQPWDRRAQELLEPGSIGPPGLGAGCVHRWVEGQAWGDLAGGEDVERQARDEGRQEQQREAGDTSHGPDSSFAPNAARCARSRNEQTTQHRRARTECRGQGDGRSPP